MVHGNRGGGIVETVTDGHERHGRLWSASWQARWPSYWQALLLTRILVGLALCALLASLPQMGPARAPAALSIALFATAANLVLVMRERRGHDVLIQMLTIDGIIVVGVVAAVPVAYAAGLVILCSIAATAMVWLGPRFRPVWLTIPATATGLVGLIEHPPFWLPVWLAWLASCALCTVALSRFGAVAAEVRGRYDDMLDGVDAVVWDGSGPAGDADYVSGRVTEVFGFDAEQFRSSSFVASHIHPEDLDEFVDARARVAAGEKVHTHYRLRDHAGRLRYVHERITVTTTADGVVRHRRGIVVDETARWEAESSVRGYLDFIEGLPIALAILRLDDPDDIGSIRVVVGNPAAASLVGMDRMLATGALLGNVLPMNDEFTRRLAHVAIAGEPLEQPMVPLGDNGEVYSLQAVPLPDRCIGVSLEDVTRRARATESLRHQARHDHLTGLANRSRFNSRLHRALRTNRSERTAVLLMDLDGFKAVNDTMGHAIGDRLLVGLAERMTTRLRGCDTIARLGGDEFAVLITDVASPDDAVAAADRLVQLCAEPMGIDRHDIRVGASIGVAVSPDHGTEAAEVLRHADAAMYRAKHSGGGAVLYREMLDPTAVSHVDLLAELDEAVRSDGLVLHYQPRIDLTTGSTVGVEALVRWHHPERGMLPPSEFIELAEVSGTINLMTRVVTERATADMSDLDAGNSFRLNINLSARNLDDPSLTHWVSDLLDASGFPPESLCFEISEEHLCVDHEVAINSLRKLAELGVRIAVDGFGHGGASLAHLRQLPLHELKVDLGSVDGVDDPDATFARSVIDLGHSLGLHVTAKGVEEAPALERLRSLGCDTAQGFHIAHPMTAEELREFIGTSERAWAETR